MIHHGDMRAVLAGISELPEGQMELF